MATVDLQSHDLVLIHRGIQLAEKDQEKKAKKLKKKIADKDRYLVPERLRFERKVKDIQEVIQRYEAIDEAILKKNVNLQKSYWYLIHVGLELVVKDLDKEARKFHKKIADKDYCSALERLEFEEKLREIRHERELCIALDKTIMEVVDAVD